MSKELAFENNALEAFQNENLENQLYPRKQNTSTMKTEKVIIKKFKVLENIEQEINGNHIILLGDNGVGKSSFIQFLEIALGKQSNIPVDANGSGTVYINKNGNKFILDVKLKDGKSVVTVTSEDGLKDNRRGAIASVVGANDFDINEFIELSKSKAGQKKQVEIFKSFLDPEIKSGLEKYETDIKITYDERTNLNKYIAELESKIKLNEAYKYINEKFTYTDLETIYSQLKSIQENNEKVSNIENGVRSKSDKIKENEGKIEALILENQSLTNDVKKGNDWLLKNKKQDISEFENQIKEANQNNRLFEAQKSLNHSIALLEKCKKESEDMSAKIESSREAIKNCIMDMSSPVEGLLFDNDVLLYKGIPVDINNLSSSEIMELGIRLKMAENPELGMLFIQRGESLGLERLKEIKALADKEGWQIIMEQVQRGKTELSIEVLS